MSDLGQGSTVAGKYRLERLIGRGGMGSVWAARHLQLDTLVAVKFIDSLSDTKDARVRFEREARAAAQLRSPHVVQILDHGIDDDERPYIAMELLEGEDLGERLRRTPRLSLQATATIVTQAAKALRRAHDGGVIHRDLKPGNIFLARFDEDEVVKLLDFGVAKIRYNELGPGAQMTQAGVIFGSPSYMSPEQARGNRVIDHRTDLWSLAVIVFRCITGSRPFEAGSIGDLVIKLCIDPLPMPTKIAPDLPPEMDRFFERAFARDPEQRFQSAALLAAEFESIVMRAAASAPGVALPAPRAPAPPPSNAGSTPRPFAPSVGSMGPSARVELAAPTDAASTPWPSSSPSGPHRPPPSAPSAPRFQEIPGPSPSSTGGYSSPPTDAAKATSQPASITPSPALLTVGAVAASLPPRSRLIAAVSLGGGAAVLLAIVIGLARHRGGPDGPASGVEASDLPSAVASVAAPIGPPPVVSVEPKAPATALPKPAASAEPAASAAPEPASSAAPAAGGSGRKPGSGKPGRGRTPNFGY